ncbi:hypothetical protein BMI91_19525 [Thioclava sediminum]|uniref:Uncharacterized protein n=1 Tax=Thioclava sediminum TaxID=1915319 RepID=A0ABX3MWE6_9RHOB|nr:hypothetical protein BMI91_19525 [Thioclava sediminum]
MRVHPETGVELVRGVRPVRLSLESQSMVVEMPGWYAIDDVSGESGIFDRDDMLVSDSAIAEMRSRGLR